MKFVAPSWDDIYEKSLALAEKVRKGENVPLDFLVGVSRGGLVMTRILSDLLDIQAIGIIRCEYYSDLAETGKIPRITQELQDDITGRNVLVIDDVADTGESLVEIQKYLSNKRPRTIRLATLYLKPGSRVLPDYHVSKTSSWIIFPWELYETFKLLSRRNIKPTVAKTHIPKKYANMLFKMDPKLKTQSGC
jgi:hypoxanthine phosphoribosyltransferase